MMPYLLFGKSIEEVGEIIKAHEELNKKYDTMREAFQTLSVEHFQLRMDYKRMSDNVKSLNSDKAILQRDCKDIMENFSVYKRETTKFLDEKNRHIHKLQTELQETIKQYTDYKMNVAMRYQEYEQGISDLNAIIGRYQATAEVRKEAKRNSNELLELKKEVSESIMDIRETLLALEASVS
jgi:chromosome segregation ATPase